MNIRAVDIEGLSKVLENKLSTGNKWMIFEPEMFKGRLEGILFYRYEDDARIFCTINNHDDGPEFRPCLTKIKLLRNKILPSYR